MTIYQNLRSRLRWQPLVLVLLAPNIAIAHDGHEGGHSIYLLAILTLLFSAVMFWRRNAKTATHRD